MKSEKKGGGQPRSSFSGRLGYVLAVAGSAVGLGNIWRFPYLAAKYGQRKQLLKISWQMLKCDQRSFYHSVKDFIWNIFCDTWLLRKYMKYNEYIRNLLRLN